jgi:hypothetical protein
MKYCKCCFSEMKKSKFVFCNECIEEGVSTFGSDVDLHTGKPIKKKQTIADKRKPTEEEWEEVPSPYKAYK